MKKRKTIFIVFFITCFAGLGFILFSQLMPGKKFDGLGYHGFEEGDIFETAYIEGTISLEPLNPDFMEFEGEPGAGKKSLTTGYGQSRSLGWIPSPDLPLIHRRVKAKERDGSFLAARYDLRDPDNDKNFSDSLLSPVKDQGDCGACWAFATYGGVEEILHAGYGPMEDFSENHVIFASGYDWGACGGGNIDMSMGYLARNTGPIRESEDPYSENNSGYCDDCAPVRYIDSVVKLPVRSGNDDFEYIKQAVYDYGSLYASMYWSENFYSPYDCSYYYSGRNTNHAVNIVGWDDSRSIKDAPGPGAFIVKNSWGTGWGDKGYFYISYYDGSLGAAAIAAFIDEPDPLLNFDRIYFYDKLGKTSSTGFGKRPAWGANIFTAANDGSIVAVGIFTTALETNYDIYIYSSFDGSSFETIKGGPYSGSLSGKGYHTIKLDDEVNVEAGDDFAMVVKFETPGHNWPIALEKPLSGYSSLASAGEGEGYISPNGSAWTDVTRSYPNSSICIKAFVREDPCVNQGLFIKGPGRADSFLVDNGKGAFIMAVATDGCGIPVTGADVVARLNENGPGIKLYDDGFHNDGKKNDGVYAVKLSHDEVLTVDTLRVTASKDGDGGEGRETMDHEDTASGGGGGGCFIDGIFNKIY